MAASDKETKIRQAICRRVKLLTRLETKELGINQQQVDKIKRGETVRFYEKSFQRLKKHFGLGKEQQ